MIEQTLGKGGMGSVYRCHNRDAPSIVAAIKLLDPAFQFNPEAKERFLREAEILYKVEHPNVVRVSNVHLDAKPPFLEMEFVDGQSLEDDLAGFGALPLDAAMDRVRQLADALHYLHRRRIYHRDIKPQNLLTDADGIVKLVDFGLAVQKSGRRITHAAAITNFGTVSYCPPEWGRQQLDPVTWDLYALGVVFYEMLTGTVAFPMVRDADPQRQMLQVLSDKKRIAALDPGPQFPPDVREIVKKLTHREPAERFKDAKALVAALEAADLDYVPATPMPARTVEPARRYAPPTVVPAAAAAAGVAGMAGVAGFLALGAVFALIAVAALAVALL
ncbi:MAG: serine/threonine protein kinase [Myxococcales bacterium]|nr:serine/threonine protein kinase [Myxococcales bacterium]